MSHVVTITPNPSIDRTLEVDSLVRGAVLRAAGTRLDAGGKGVNVSRALESNGIGTTAVLPVGGIEGEQLVGLLGSHGVRVEAVRISGPVRVNITVAEPDGTITKLNEPGPQLTSYEVDALLAASSAAARDADWVVGCGSLPVGAPEDFYGLLAARIGGGVRYGVDSSGPALRSAVKAGVDLIKPNLAELSELVDHPLLTLGAVVTAARELVSSGVETVLVSLGGDGAVLVDATHELHGGAHIDAVRSTVGAGDAFLAGYLSATAAGRPEPAEALATALAWGAAAASLPGSRMPAPADVAAVPVELASHIESDRPLTQEPS